MGIRDKILEKTYQQSLKLLNPKSKEFSIHFPKADIQPPLTDKEKRALGPTGGLLEYVQMGSLPIGGVYPSDAFACPLYRQRYRTRRYKFAKLPTGGVPI